MSAPDMKAPGLATLSALLALPWCCIAPLLLSTLGMSAAGLGWLVGPRHLWIFVALSSGSLGRSLYLSFVKRQGAPAFRALSLAIALVTAGIWVWRFQA